MPTLTLYQDYSRQLVHDIFAPETPFTTGAGTWGLQGIIALPQRVGDFVFFVTFGQQQGAHIFDEGITEEGVLSWQSQPKQSLRDAQIQQFLHHDELQHSIYLFLRTARNREYTYLGTLKYVSHDSERERPVWFQWQILEWPMPQAEVLRIGLTLQPGTPLPVGLPPDETGRLVETPALSAHPQQGKSTVAFRTRKGADYAASDARNRALGLAGELLVLAYEQQALKACGRRDLAASVRHVAQIEGDGAGYDILSYTSAGETKYIEVKTTRGAAETAFYMTSNEVAFAAQHPGPYYVYRVYDLDLNHFSGKF